MADAYRDLIAWQKSTRLALDIYRSTQAFPKDELYGLTSQMRRAAVSIASNIAEGKGRFSRKEFVQFLYRARGSLLELETQLFIAGELGYVDQAAGKRNQRPDRRTRPHPQWTDKKRSREYQHRS
jgi:four helix bundle protein